MKKSGFPIGEPTPRRHGVFPRSLPGALCAAVLLACTAIGSAASDDCPPTAGDSYVCGIPSAEDLVQVPGTSWLVASGFAGPHALGLIDSVNKSWRVLAPSETFSERHDLERFAGCPGAPVIESLVTHGLDIRDEGDGLSTLYAVGHGGREAVEVFELRIEDGSNASLGPEVVWIGCVPTPDGHEANSVAVLADGGLLATIPLEHGRTFAQAMTGAVTGAVHHWSADTGEWTRLADTAQPYANGIVVSEDESEFYVASSGLSTISAYSNSVPASALWTTDVMTLLPDNLRWSSDGQLLVVGLVKKYPDCDPYNEAGEFELGKFAACPRPYEVYSVDTQAGATTEVARGPLNPRFSNATTAIVVDNTLWVGTFGGDRVAYRKLEE